jgi:hypothetical protein
VGGRAGGVAQVVENLCSKCEAEFHQKKKKKRERERKKITTDRMLECSSTLATRKKKTKRSR